MLSIYYGIIENYIDITNICYEQLLNDNLITIPSGDDNRANIFSDPLFGLKKKIFVKINDNKMVEYDDFYEIEIKLNNNGGITINTINKLQLENDINDKLSIVHSNLKINYGHLYEELPEQKMVIRYLKGHEKVLEIGGNIGRNSLVISSILNDSSNLVVLECDDDISKQLEENKSLNNFNFHVENSALSKRKLIQKGWDTICSDELLDGYKNVNTITLDEFKNKYNIIFDTLVLDCEGAFYYILMDMPDILNNINLIIMENDYWDISKKEYVDEILKKNDFYVDYTKSGGWGPCQNNFFEVWKKI